MSSPVTECEAFWSEVGIGEPAGGGKSTGKGEARVAAPKAGVREGGTDVCYLLNRLPGLSDHVQQGSEDTGVSPNEQGFYTLSFETRQFR